MARQRDPRRDEAYNIWVESNQEKPLKEIAEELECSASQIRKWKSQDKWERNGNVTNEKGSVTKESAPKKPKPQKNRSGNPNPVKQFTKRNSAAVSHGLFAKYLPEDTLDIIEGMNGRSAADLIYDQIQIQYAAIIRSQKIMWVEDKDDTTSVVKKVVDAEGFASTDYEIALAWDKQANFMNAQSRAMGELRSLIKQFNDIAHENDERRLKLEQMQLGVEKTKVETEFLQARTELIKGKKKDTRLLEALIAAKGGDS